MFLKEEYLLQAHAEISHAAIRNPILRKRSKRILHRLARRFVNTYGVLNAKPVYCENTRNIYK